MKWALKTLSVMFALLENGILAETRVQASWTGPFMTTHHVLLRPGLLRVSDLTQSETHRRVQDHSLEQALEPERARLLDFESGLETGLPNFGQTTLSSCASVPFYGTGTAVAPHSLGCPVYYMFYAKLSKQCQ